MSTAAIGHINSPSPFQPIKCAPDELEFPVADDNYENKPPKPNKVKKGGDSEKSKTNRHTADGKPPRDANGLSKRNNILLRRPSSTLPPKGLDVSSGLLSRPMTPSSRCVTPSLSADYDANGETVLGSQKARLLVASQQCLVSRLQDLRNELDGMDNEVARVKTDIMNSRRYFSAMTGLPCAPTWPATRPSDSAYTSPTFCGSHSSEGSPYSSDTENPQGRYHHRLCRPENEYHQHSSNEYPLNRYLRPDSANSGYPHNACTQSGDHQVPKEADAMFKALQDFGSMDSQGQGRLVRTDSCSSFMSWRSDVELAGVFPDDADPDSYGKSYARRRQSKDLDTDF